MTSISGVIERSRLVGRLLSPEARPLTIIHAGPGYGKTTLLTQYAEARAASTAVLRLFAADARSLPTRLDRLLARHREERGPDKRAAIVIDDFDRADDAGSAVDLLNWLERQSGVTVVLATGRHPHVPIGRLKANRAIDVITSADLAFSPAEVRLFLRQQGYDVRNEVVSEVMRRSQGWPAGLVLAMSIPELAPNELVTHLSGSQWDFIEYFTDALAHYGLVDIDRLSRLAVLETLSAEICRAIDGPRSEWNTISQMARDDFFTRPVPRRGHRVRFHPLFREFLLYRLHSENSAEEVVRLQGRAAEALVSCGEPGQAVGHFVKAGRPAEAARLLSSIGFGAIDQVETADQESWTLALSGSQVYEYPWLSALEGRLRRLRLDFDGALVALSQARFRFESVGDVDGVAWTTSEIHQVGYADFSYAESIRATEKAVRDVGYSAAARTSLAAHLCWMRCAAGPADAAIAAGEQALAAVHHIEGADLRRSLHARAKRNLALARLLRGHPQSAARLLDESEIATLGEDNRWAGIIQGMALHLTGNDYGAWTAFDTVLKAGGHHNSIQRQWAHQWRGNMLRSRGDLNGAIEDYGKAGRIAMVDHIVTVLQSGHGAQALDETAPERLEASDLIIDRGGAELVRGLLLLGREPETAQRALRRAENIFDDAGFTHHARSVTAYRAMALERSGATKEAEILRSWVTGWLIHSGMTRLYWQGSGTAGPSARDMRSRAARTGAEAGAGEGSLLLTCSNPEIRERVERALAVGTPIRSVETLLNGYGLTWREIDVFLAYFLRIVTEMPEGSTFRDRCARYLAISEHTLKTHISRIRKKLGIEDEVSPQALSAWLSGIEG
ncbi:hypothetical protein [Streptosporangium sp. NPDC051022]|uniref:hypothetical protein n=1 Tax=Streptosporangium sp. NPDC051022 TaxID=3155752 RepID=UPI0034157609